MISRYLQAKLQTGPSLGFLCLNLHFCLAANLKKGADAGRAEWEKDSPGKQKTVGVGLLWGCSKIRRSVLEGAQKKPSLCLRVQIWLMYF